MKKDKAGTMRIARQRIYPDCPLCQVAFHERFEGAIGEGESVLHEDEACVVVVCRSCDVPMLVHKEHVSEVSDGMKDMFRSTLESTCEGSEGWYDDRMRSIHDHYHAHWRAS